MKTHFVVRTAGVVGNHAKFVGLHAVMLCKGFNFVATHVFCYFFAQDGSCRRQDMAKQPKKNAQSCERNKHMVITITVSPGLSQNLSKACARLNF